MTAPPALVTEFQTRFLYPFWFRRGSLADVTRALLADRTPSDAGGRAVWEPATPPALYLDEFLDSLQQYLFPDATVTDRQCEYLRVTDVVGQQWFKDTHVTLAKTGPLKVTLVPGAGIELFLTTQGIGVLSVTLTADGDAPLDADAVQSFNYALAQFRRRDRPVLTKPHPSDDPARWAKIPPEKQADLTGKKPTAASDIDTRMAAAGGGFTMQELVARLILGPLPADKYRTKPVEPRELSAYTVVRLGHHDFCTATAREQFLPLLSRLAQVEEAGHAGSTADHLIVPHAVLNSRHLAAVGILGSAHLVADQSTPTAPVAFDDSRVPLVRDKYFISYLTAVLQRQTLNHGVEQATDILVGPADLRAAGTAGLRRNLLQFGVGGQFTQISSRHAHHRYYQLCREGLDVLAGWSHLGRVIGDLDTSLRTDGEQKAQAQLGRVASEVARSVNEITAIQRIVHMVEYVLVAVYLAHLWHMLFADNHKFKDWFDHHGMSGDWVVTAGTAVFSLLGFGAVFLFNQVRPHQTPAPPTPPTTNGTT